MRGEDFKNLQGGRKKERMEKMRKNGLWKMGMKAVPAIMAACLLAGCGGDGKDGAGTGSDGGADAPAESSADAGGAREGADAEQESGAGSQEGGDAQAEGDAQGGDQLAKILEAGKIVIGTEGTYSPNS